MTSAEILSSFARFGIHLGLERIQKLLADLGNPQQHVPIIHVAGTNGKGSVCAYLASILTAAGYKVGRYTSPHLVDWRERICVNSEWISDADLLEVLTQVQAVIKPEFIPTQFEVITAAMWRYFAKAKVDIAIIETGLGGRLDATNVCDQPLVSIITSISRDHWQRLGDSLAAIATEKAGIIKPNCQVVAGLMPAEAMAVIIQKAKSCQAPLIWAQAATKKAKKKAGEKADHLIWQGVEYPQPLLGDHQLLNSGIALTAIQALQNQGWQISATAIAQGMAQTRWPGRLQWAQYKYQDKNQDEYQDKSHKILLDGAHNLAAAEYLRLFVDQNFPNLPKKWIIGMLNTKDHAGILRALLRSPDLLFLVPVTNHQSVDPEIAAAIAADILEIPAYKCQSLKSALELAFSQKYFYQDNLLPDNGLVTLCGSLYLVGEFLA